MTRDEALRGIAAAAQDYSDLLHRLSRAASVDTRRMAETGTGSGRSPSGAVPAQPGDAQPEVSHD